MGASRGLGAAFAEILSRKNISCSSFSRKLNGFDAHSQEKWSSWRDQWMDLGPTHIIYFAGGGPHGNFGSKEFKDHLWSFRVNFEFPAYLLHSILSSNDCPQLQQICFIGSAIAEAAADPQAASYSAAKHALLGLISSVQQEEHGSLDLRLFSPSYMDTTLLPANAWPRQRPETVHSSLKVATALWNWLQDPTCANQHQVFE